MITVASRRAGAVGEYIGRPSALGNPFRVEKFGRDECIRLYSEWLDAQIAAKTPAVVNELNRLLAIAREGNLTLVCWCKPLACHGDVIKRVLESRAK